MPPHSLTDLLTNLRGPDDPWDRPDGAWGTDPGTVLLDSYAREDRQDANVAYRMGSNALRRNELPAARRWFALACTQEHPGAGFRGILASKISTEKDHLLITFPAGGGKTYAMLNVLRHVTRASRWGHGDARHLAASLITPTGQPLEAFLRDVRHRAAPDGALKEMTLCRDDDYAAEDAEFYPQVRALLESLIARRPAATTPGPFHERAPLTQSRLITRDCRPHERLGRPLHQSNTEKTPELPGRHREQHPQSLPETICNGGDAGLSVLVQTLHTWPRERASAFAHAAKPCCSSPAPAQLSKVGQITPKGCSRGGLLAPLTALPACPCQRCTPLARLRILLRDVSFAGKASYRSDRGTTEPDSADPGCSTPPRPTPATNLSFIHGLWRCSATCFLAPLPMRTTQKYREAPAAATAATRENNLFEKARGRDGRAGEGCTQLSGATTSDAAFGNFRKSMNSPAVEQLAQPSARSGDVEALLELAAITARRINVARIVSAGGRKRHTVARMSCVTLRIVLPRPPQTSHSGSRGWLASC
ncbi:hypothetical protein ACFVZT_12250 [Streptomyces sp. NPDC058321]|uniref:hypothetical protein n=1 Tax=Streptomyces sp. NPDC058321 TaxID=3346445 RepID=UPI0036E45E86